MAGSITAKELKECFTALDLDGDGLLSRKELALAVRALGKNPTEKEMQAFFDSQGKTQMSMDFASYKAAFDKPFRSPFDQDKEMRDAFKILDADGDGTIQESELRQMLLTIGEALNHQEVDQLMESVEIRSDGKVAYDKFIDMLVNGCPAGQDSF